MTGSADKRERTGLIAAAVALTCLVPFAKMIALGQSFYFRDLGAQFIPDRLYVVHNMLRGQTAYWNPLVHGGEPSLRMAWDYPLHLLQLLIPNEFGISLFLILHVSFAAVAFLLLLRDLGIRPEACATGAFVYALGGFSLSLINLYVYIPTLAWSPLFILAFRRALRGSWRDVALGALALGMLITSGGLELALQACLIAVLLSPPTTAQRFARSAIVAILGLGLAAAVIAPTITAIGSSARGSGLSTESVLGYSISPMGFLQAAIAGLFGNPVNVWTEWWGVRFFSNLYPYILSLYVGPLVLVLAVAGVLTRRTYAWRFVLLAIAAAVVCLGEHAFWGWFFNLSPGLRLLRFPVKAFYSIQFALAALAAFAVDAILAGTSMALRRTAIIAAIVSGVFASLILAPELAPGVTQWFMSHLLPGGLDPRVSAGIARSVATDAGTGGLVALVAAVVLLLALRGRLSPSGAAVALAALVAADLIRSGAGLNPAVSPSFFEVSPEMQAHLPLLRSGGRTFSCDVMAAQSYRAAVRAGMSDPNDLEWMASKDTLYPEYNLREGIPTALSIDRTMLVPEERVLIPDLVRCRNLPFIVPRLQAAGVDRIISLDPLDHSDLRILAEIAPRRIAPLVIRIYELTGAAPRFSIPAKLVHDDPDRVEFDVTLDDAGTFVLLDPWAPGWSASVNGTTTEVVPTGEGHRSLTLPKGVSRVVMRYEPPNLRTGIAIALASLVVCGILFLRGGRGGSAKSFAQPTVERK